MATYKEIVYMVLDELKLGSDDSHFVEEHVLFLADKYRALILKQRYSDIRKEIPLSNYQTICIDLEQVTLPASGICNAGNYLRSTKRIPDMLNLTTPDISSMDLFSGIFNYINPARFKYAGSNKNLTNQIYGTIAPDHFLYIKSSNSQFIHLRKVKLSGIFEDSSKLVGLQCSDADEQAACDVMDMQYPLEEALIPVVVELIVKELSAFKYQAKDDKNDANDNLSDIAAYIRQQMAMGRRSDLYKDNS